MFFARISTFAPNKLFHQKIYIMKRIVTLVCIVLIGMTGWAQNSDEKMDKEPLIVVNGEIFNVTQKFDFRNARNEDFAKLIGVEPDDIKDITVFKDAAATVIWGERGKWGVIEIKTNGKVKKSKKKIKMIGGTVSDAAGPLWMVNVVEINEQDSIVGHAVTDSLGHFKLKVVNPKDKIRVSYIGTKTMTLDIYKKSTTSSCNHRQR